MLIFHDDANVFLEGENYKFNLFMWNFQYFNELTLIATLSELTYKVDEN